MRFLSLLFLTLFLIFAASAAVNDRPVIGILTLPEYPQNGGSFPKETTFIHAQYVKFVEQAGAVAVPIHYNNSFAETEYILNHINGVLFTGGAVGFIDETTGKLSQLAITAKHIFHKVQQLNDKGVNFPLWGTCMGHQLLMFLANDNESPLSFTDAYETNDKLIYHFDDYKKTKLFSDFPGDLILKGKNQPLTANFHHFGVLTKTFNDSKNQMNKFFRLLATSTDTKGVSYVANTEAYKYPIFTSQYHPEITEYTFAYKTNHSEAAREFMYYLALKFVGEARKNNQSFKTYEELVARLVQTSAFDKMGRESDGDFYDNYYFLHPNSMLVSE